MPLRGQKGWSVIPRILLALLAMVSAEAFFYIATELGYPAGQLAGDFVLNAMRPAVIEFLMFVVLMGTIWFVADYLIYRRPRAFDLDTSRPDLEKWDKQNVFKLAQVAYLWRDQEPMPVQSMDDGAKRTFELLRNAMETRALIGRLSIDEALGSAMERHNMKVDERAINVDTNVGRQALRDFAKAEGVRPIFLFKDARGI